MNISRWLFNALALAGLGGLILFVYWLLTPPPVLRIAVHRGLEGVPIKSIAQRFSQKQATTVQIVEVDYDQLFDEELRAITAPESRFDVVALDDPWLSAFVKVGGLRLLKAGSLAGDFSDFPKPCQEVCQFNADNLSYALPFMGNSQLFCRNKRSVEKQPKDWEAVRDIPSNPPDRIGYAMRLGPGNSTVNDFLPILWMQAPEVFSKENYWDMQAAENVKAAFAMFRSLADKQDRASAITADVDVAAAVALGSASTGVVWSAWAMALDSQEPEVRNQLAFDWFRDGSDYRDPELGAWLLAIPKRSKQPQLAEQFLRFAVSPEQLELAARDGNPPPRVSVLNKLVENAVKSGDLNKKALFEAQSGSLQHARPRPRTPCWREIEQTVSTYLEGWSEKSSDKLVGDLLEDLRRIHVREQIKSDREPCPVE